MTRLTMSARAWFDARRPVEDGQTVVEYALVVGLVSIVIIATLVTAGTGWITTLTSKITSKVG